MDDAKHRRERGITGNHRGDTEGQRALARRDGAFFARIFLIVCLALMVAPAFAEEGRMAKGEVEGFALEIPDEFGKKQAVLEGAHAGFEPGGSIKISEVRANIVQKEKGNIVVKSPYALYHRDTKIVTTDQAIAMDSSDMHITGKGLVWETEKQDIQIRENVRVVLKNINKDPK